MLRNHLRLSFLLYGLAALAPAFAHGQTRKGEEIAQAKRALSSVYDALKLNYYDQAYRGLDLSDLYTRAREELDHAQTAQQRYRAIDRMLEALDDSHTGFVAYSRLGLWHYHIGFHFFGDIPIITKVDLGSSAEAAGVRPGDEIVGFSGQRLTRSNYIKIMADFMAADSVRPLQLSVRGTNGALSTLTLTADTMEIRKIGGSRFRRLYSQAKDSAEFASSHVQVSIADSVFVWRLPHFAAIDKGLGDVIKRARKHRVLIMDLRGNPSGSIETLTKLLGFFVDQELVVGDLHLRTTKEKFTAKPRSDRISGRVFIVVDSETASAAEIFARIMQLQGKATVFGDRTAGMVMASQYFPADEEMGAFITVSDFVLYNGERLEKVGVKPDVLAVETPQHVAAAGDPVLALALLRAGIRMNAAMARQLMQRAN